MLDDVYYNEHEPFAARWLTALCDRGLIERGEVDGRDIQRLCDDVRPSHLSHRRQVHLFAGIGGWERALQLAGWPHDRPVWTGSCPCQPFSVAGEGKGEADERHLWPFMRMLIEEQRPNEIFGEQVASKLGREWLARVHLDLEALGYTFGAADLCAAGSGAPHIRQRLYWVAHREGYRWQPRWTEPRWGSVTSSSINGLAHLQNVGRERFDPARGRRTGPAYDRAANGLGHHHHQGPQEQRSISGVSPATAYGNPRQTSERAGTAVDGMEYAALPEAARFGTLGQQLHRPPVGHTPWSDWMANAAGIMGDSGQQQEWGSNRRAADWRDRAWSDHTVTYCRDGKYRRTPSLESQIQPLAYGFPGRVGLLRGAGNAIVPETAAQFIRAYLEATGTT